MNLIELLETKEAEMIEEALEKLECAHLRHYEAEGFEKSKERLIDLYELTVKCVKTRHLDEIISYAEHLAYKRYLADYDLREVQTLFNILEETLWTRIVNELPPSELGEALGLISTVLGAAKDKLATTYVALATKIKVQSLDLSELFKGAAETVT